MGLQEQHIAFKFTGGIETKMDSKAVPPARLLGLENGVFHRANSIKKRNGYSATARAIDGSVSLIENARRLAARGDELLLLTNNRCYSKQSGADQWTDAGALIAPTGFDRPAVHTGSSQTVPDHATLNGVRVYAWEDSRGGVWWTVVDAVSGAVHRAPEQADASAISPRCVAVGAALHIYYAVPTQSTVMVIVVNPSTPTATVAPTILVSDLDATNSVYDACATTRTGTPALMVWYEHATTNFRVGYVDAAGVLGSPASGYPSVLRVAAGLDATTPIALSYAYSDGGSGDGVFVCAVNAAAVARMWLTTGDLGAPLSASIYTTTDVQRIAMASTSDGTTWFAFEENATDSSNKFCVINSVDLTATLGAQRTLRSVSLVSRAFLVDDEAFAVFVHDTVYFNTYLTLRLSDFANAGRHLPGSAMGDRWTDAGARAADPRPHLSSVHVDDGVATVALPYKTRLESENNDKFTEAGLRLITLNFNDDDSHQYAQAGRGLWLAAACPQHYDGYRWTEQGFHVGPEVVATPVQSTAGALTQTGTYEYKFWYEWTDSQGEIHRGPESPGTTVELTGVNDEVTILVPTLRVTQKANVRVCVGRSLNGDTATLYRVSSLDPTTAGDPNGYLANDTSVDTVTFVDRMSDADARLEEQLYTVGGILSNDPVPLGSHITAGKNRLFCTDAEDGNIVRFSKRFAFGFAAEFAPELQHDIDPLGGNITALATMDDVVYAFKAGAIFAFNGDGPFEDGSTASGGIVAGFSGSQLITSDVGCTDPSSIVLTPHGLMFKSSKGLRLITRAREIVPVGDPVTAYDAQTVRRATVMPDRTAVLFLTSSGSSLYFDYDSKQWSTFTNHEGFDAAVVDNTYHYLRTDDVVFRETPGEYLDGTARITLRLETAWLHLHEHLQGFQRFWKLLLLGTWASPHQLGVSYRLSFDEAWSEPYYLDATGDTSAEGWITGDSANPIGEDPITGTAYGEGDYGDGPYGGRGPDVYWWRYGIHEAGASVQFRFEDFEKAGLAGASFELTEMTIVGGVMKPDIRPFSAARST